MARPPSPPVSRTRALEVARSVRDGSVRSYVSAAIHLSEYVLSTAESTSPPARSSIATEALRAAECAFEQRIAEAVAAGEARLRALLSSTRSEGTAQPQGRACETYPCARLDCACTMPERASGVLPTPPPTRRVLPPLPLNAHAKKEDPDDPTV